MTVCMAVALSVYMLQHGPVSEEGRSTSQLLGVLYDFQSLFTGLLAVAAAYLTVKEMRKTDENSEKRHQAAMRLAIRGDRLNVHRALHPQFQELRHIAKEMEELDRLKGQMDRDRVEAMRFGQFASYDRNDMETLILQTYPLIRQIKSVLHRHQLEQGADLFDGDLTYRLTNLKEKTDIAADGGRFVYQYYQMEERDRSGDDDRMFTNEVNAGHDDLITDYPAYFAASIDHVLGGMSRMAKLYDVNEEWIPE